MPSALHQGLVALFRNRLALACELVEQGLGLALPPYDELRLGSAKLEERAPAEYVADHVVELWQGAERVLAIVVEVQLRRDGRKRRSWPLYLASLRASLGCPCWLVVVTPRPVVARWCAEPIELGHPGFVLTPLVLGPGALPMPESEEQLGEAPELGVLCAIATGKEPRGPEVALTVLGALARLSARGGLDDEQSRIYTDLVMASLGEAARKALEELMSTGGYEYQSEFARKYVAQGEAKGRAEGREEGRAEGEEKGRAEGQARAILAVLRTRGLDVPSAVEQRVTECTSLADLDAWLERAVRVERAEEIFGQPDPAGSTSGERYRTREALRATFRCTRR